MNEPGSDIHPNGQARYLRYRPRRVWLDAAQGLVGLLLAYALWRLAPEAKAAIWIAVGLAALFGAYCVRTAMRARTVVEMGPRGLRAFDGFRARELEWARLDKLELRFFRTMRDREQGFIELRLRGGGPTLSLDGELESFMEIVETAARAARANGVSVTAVTAANLEALGIDALV